MGKKTLDLFCGAGGLSLGFKLAGFDIIGGIDFQKDAIETHELNFKNSRSLCCDIKSISNEKIYELFGKDVDVIIGGPPCQGFSAGNRQSKFENDPRNDLFFEFIRFVEVLHPSVVVIENVRQILTKNNGYAKNAIVKILSNLDYDVAVDVLDASNYGVPQKRKRAIFVGVKKGLGHFDFDLLKKNDEFVTVGEAISELYDVEITNEMVIKDKPKTSYQKYLREKNNLIYNHVIKYPNELVQARMSFVPEGGNWANVPENLWANNRRNRHSSAYKRLDSTLPSITIDTGHMNYFHPKFNRVPTVRESARIQSFPDDFIFCGTVTSQLRQVGNAVPPLLGRAIANAINEVLNDE